MVCSKWAASLVGLLNKVNYSHMFIAAKQYQAAEFCNNIKKIPHKLILY